MTGLETRSRPGQGHCVTGVWFWAGAQLTRCYLGAAEQRRLERSHPASRFLLLPSPGSGCLRDLGPFCGCEVAHAGAHSRLAHVVAMPGKRLLGLCVAEQGWL